MLSNFYIDGWSYQENELPRQNILDGHEVKIVASTETYKLPNIICYIPPSQYVNEDGIEVVRVPYKKLLPHGMGLKIRAYEGVEELIEEFKPEVILHHGSSAYELLTVKKYVQKNPSVKFFVDSHADFHNSAKSFLSREILHRRFYAPILRKTLPCIEKILCISLETMDFLREYYRIPQEKLEFYPLGGNIVEDTERKVRRKTTRDLLGIRENDIMMVHAGKLQKEKKTPELLEAFSKVHNPSFRLFLVGSIADDVKPAVEFAIAADERIIYAGWKEKDGLLDFLCASDIYLQPGTQSATLQNALCCSCPIMVFPYKSHVPFLKENGFFVETIEDIIDVFKAIAQNPKFLRDMSLSSAKIAREILDYRILAARLYK